MKTLLVLVVFLFVVAPAQAGVARAIAITKAVKTSSSTTRVTAKFAANDPVYGAANAANDAIFTKAIDIGAASLGAVFRKRAFSPWGALITAGLVAAGYYLDSQSGQVLQTSSATTGIGYCGFNSADITLQACIDYANAHRTSQQISNGDYYYWQPPSFYVGSGFGDYEYDIYIHHQDGSSNNISVWLSDSDTEHPEQDVSLTDQQISESLLPNIQVELLPDILTDPETGLPDTEITELADAAQELQNEIDSLTDSDPNNDPAETTPYQRIDEANYTQNVENNRIDNAQNDSNSETDYTFNPNDVEYDTELETPEKSDLAEILNHKYEDLQDFESRVGVEAVAGSCTISIPVSLGGYSRNTEMDFCQFETEIQLIGDIILAISYLVAGFIVMGVKV